MKIIHIVRQFYPCIGGVENFVLNLAVKQKELGNEVSILTLDRNFANLSKLEKKDEYCGIPIQRISFVGIKRYPIAFSCLRYLGSAEILHVHCVDFFIDFLSLTKIFHRKKIILSTHGGFFHTKWFLPLKKIYFRIITRIVMKGCNKILASSHSDKKMFSSIASNVALVNNGVNVEKFLSINKKSNFGQFVYIGRLDAHKRIDNLIKILALLVAKVPEVTLHIIGPDWNNRKSDLERLASSLNVGNKVSFLGTVPDEKLLDELSQAHIFLSASEYEGFGISVVEAMASGTLCVINAIPAFKCLVHDRVNGFLVDFNNPLETADIIYKILFFTNQQYEKIASLAKRNVSQYSWDIVKDKVDRIYKEVLTANKPE